MEDEKLLIEELYPISDKLKIYGLPNDAGVKFEIFFCIFFILIQIISIKN